MFEDREPVIRKNLEGEWIEMIGADNGPSRLNISNGVFKGRFITTEIGLDEVLETDILLGLVSNSYHLGPRKYLLSLVSGRYLVLQKPKNPTFPLEEFEWQMIFTQRE